MAGQAAALPSQVSARSQMPAAARQVTPLARSVSAGQVLLAPLQLSATSQTPALARHSESFWFAALDPTVSV